MTCMGAGPRDRAWSLGFINDAGSDLSIDTMLALNHEAVEGGALKAH